VEGAEMKNPALVKSIFVVLALVALVYAPKPAFAQHGGGHGGGGGGFHGGGFHGSGPSGGYRGGAPRGAYRGGPPIATTRSMNSHGYGRPAYGGPRSHGVHGGRAAPPASARFGGSMSARNFGNAAARIGGNAGGNAGNTGNTAGVHAPSGGAAAAGSRTLGNSGNSPVAGSARTGSVGTTGLMMMWNSRASNMGGASMSHDSSARGIAGLSVRSSAISPNRAVLNIAASHFGSSLMGSSGFDSSASLAGTLRVVNGSRGFTGSIGAGHTLGTGFGGSSTGFHGDTSNRFHGGTKTTGFHDRMTTSFHGATFNSEFNRGVNHGFGFHDGFHRFHGCFNCCFHFFFGFGFGFGWGPWWGPWGFWGPGWVAPVPNYSVTYPPANSDTGADNDSSSSTFGGYFPRPSFGESLDTQSRSNPNSVSGNVLLYLKDGTMCAATDYWIAGGKLHYVVDYSGEEAVGLDELDLQRTVDENAKLGVRFVLKPSPERKQ